MDVPFAGAGRAGRHHRHRLGPCKRRRPQAAAQRRRELGIETAQARLGLGQEGAEVEGLQRVVDHQAAARARQGGRVARRLGHGGQQQVQQFADQHRRRQHGVVALAAARVAEVEAAARGQHQVQEEVALVVAALAVATAWLQRHQVEFRDTLCAGKGTVVQADDADMRERQAAQAAHGREGDAAGGHTAARRVVQLLAQRGLQHREGQGLGARPVGAAALQGVEELGQRELQFALVVQFVSLRLQELRDGLQQQRLPGAGRTRLRHGPVQLAQAGDELRQRTQGQRGAALGVGGGKQAIEGR